MKESSIRHTKNVTPLNGMTGQDGFLGFPGLGLRDWEVYRGITLQYAVLRYSELRKRRCTPDRLVAFRRKDNVHRPEAVETPQSLTPFLPNGRSGWHPVSNLLRYIRLFLRVYRSGWSQMPCITEYCSPRPEI
ncbi:hypothetical protein SBOR_9647 [Sclerotinia borealis F-4128]|uniref:Uncharacterized protein n=1 Tax=Sclerotinia borealis (strain F-4128) TaxID=1432307 RepID=W9BZG7_SCLBF|nr:hypothetical protein SBOR_9647 [Sclerotinia borealis F-4128]